MRSWRPTVAEAEIDVQGGIDRPPLEQAHSAALLALAQGLASRHGLGVLEGRAVGGASDGNLTAAAGVPTLDGLGAVGDGAHADHEWASLARMADRAALVAALIPALLALPRA